MNKATHIRRVKAGDEEILAHIQTESWKEAFKEIVPAELLSKSTDIERVTAMYKKLLDEHKGNGYILELDQRPHCIAWWDAAREKDMAGYSKIMFWVFDNNVRAIKFYEAHGFAASGKKQAALGAVEEMYVKEL